MKILRITAQGLQLFKKDLDICFYTQQRVCEEDKDNLYRLMDNYYLHSACAFIGINASGKTSVLKVISLALNIVKNEPINHVVLAPGENRHFEPGENSQFQPDRNRQSEPGGCSQPRFGCQFKCRSFGCGRWPEALRTTAEKPSQDGGRGSSRP